MLTRNYQGVNQGFTEAGKWPLPNWNYESIFPTEFMVTAKSLFFSFLLTFFWFLLNLVPFFKNRSCLCCFLFLVFFLLLCYSHTEQLKKRCTLRGGNCVLLLHNKSLYVCLLLLLNSLHSVRSPLEEGWSRFSCKNEGLGGNSCKVFSKEGKHCFLLVIFGFFWQ